ncbi:MAG TPA: stage II sporulation protein P [Ruminococcaceae bacterium]|nr:stage II sporulation protein P [Oscillospiraceae bacterium]
MQMIRTSIRRKLFLSAGSGIAALAVPVAAILSFSVIFGVTQNNKEVENRARSYSFENANSNESVLFDPEITEKNDTVIVEADEDEEQNVNNMIDFPGKYIYTVNMNDSSEDLSTFSVHSGKIVNETFGKGNGPEFISLPNGGQLRNCTEIPTETVNAECSVNSVPEIEMYSDEPQVLILHTHTTESYEPYEKDWYDESYTSRSADPGNGVVAVGEAIAGQLAAAGINVIHDCTMHDLTYNGAYSRSLGTALGVLDRYPTVKVVLDIHRDAIEYEDGTRVSAVTDIDGKRAAQTMIICAADDGTYGVPGFMNNLHFASALQQSMESRYPTLTRPVLFQYCQYNQQVSPGALLIEVGSHGNSIDQAVYSGELIGKSLAELLKDNCAEAEAVPVAVKMPIYFIDRVR